MRSRRLAKPGGSRPATAKCGQCRQCSRVLRLEFAFIKTEKLDRLSCARSYHRSNLECAGLTALWIVRLTKLAAESRQAAALQNFICKNLYHHPINCADFSSRIVIARLNTSSTEIAVMQRWSIGQSRSMHGAQSGGCRMSSACGDRG